MKRLLLWVFPAAIVVLLILQMTHTGPGDLWAGMAVGVFVLFGYPRRNREVERGGTAVAAPTEPPISERRMEVLSCCHETLAPPGRSRSADLRSS